VGYLVGTPRGRGINSRINSQSPWQKLRDTVEVKLLSQGREVYVLAKSQGRREKETAIRRKKLARLLRTLRQLRRARRGPGNAHTLLHKLGAAHKEAGRAWNFVKITVPQPRASPSTATPSSSNCGKTSSTTPQERDTAIICCAAWRRDEAAPLWERYMQLTEIEAAFKTLKSDLQLRPIRHHVELRIEAHILVCFLAFCLSVTLRSGCKPTPRD